MVILANIQKGANMNIIYTCYDNKQKEFFNKNGLQDILTGRHIKTGKRFWVFERTEKLNEVLKRWNQK